MKNRLKEIVDSNGRLDVIVTELHEYWGLICWWFLIHSIAQVLWEEICGTVMIWYTLTGCDAVSQFLKYGKVTA